MGPDLTSLPRTTACPACGGALRPEATFCSLCFFDFRAAADPVPPQPPVVPEQPSYDGLDPLTAPLIDLVLPAPSAPQPAPAAPPAPVVPVADLLGPVPAAAPAQRPQPTWPCGRCGDPNPLDTDLCGTCGSSFLANAKERPRLELPYVGDLYAMSRGSRIGLAVAALCVVLLPLALVTLLLTPGKATPQGSQQGGTTSVSTTAP